jgi:hypothetical protein
MACIQRLFHSSSISLMNRIPYILLSHSTSTPRFYHGMYTHRELYSSYHALFPVLAAHDLLRDHSWHICGVDRCASHARDEKMGFRRTSEYSSEGQRPLLPCVSDFSKVTRFQQYINSRSFFCTNLALFISFFRVLSTDFVELAVWLRAMVSFLPSNGPRHEFFLLFLLFKG